MTGHDSRATDDGDPPPTPYLLPISKLRGVPQTARVALKSRKITNCLHLLAAANTPDKRAALARQTGLDGELLVRLAQRADMARISGVGAVFGMMLEDLGIRDVGALARQEPEPLHAMIRDYNLQEHVARRSPTLEEVQDWIVRARELPEILT